MKIRTISSSLTSLKKNNNLVTKSVEYSASAAAEANLIAKAEQPILQESSNLNATEFECLANKNDPATWILSEAKDNKEIIIDYIINKSNPVSEDFLEHKNFENSLRVYKDDETTISRS
ncbi:hypothetical protein PGB90_004645 [Kerria lacca]